MEKGISYLNRTFQDYKEALIEFSKKYYPDLATSYDDASVASWQIDLAADIADNLSYHIDRVYQETNIDSAQERASLYAIARNNGVKIPGPKGSMAEVKISCILPVGENEPNWDVAPIIKRGTKFSSTSQTFELLEDVDFALQYDVNGNTNRTILPKVNTNGIITGYTVSKLAVVTAGETRVYRQVLHASDIYPFMEVVLPFEGVMNIESILEVDGTDTRVTPPPYGDFYSVTDCEGKKRFYEVDNLAQNWAWLDQENNGKPVMYTYGQTGLPYNSNSENKPVFYITKGEWRPIERKFVTEYLDNGYMKIIFGSGNGSSFNNVIGPNSDMAQFSRWQITRILNNDNLGILPEAEHTLFILYRIGGGTSSNVPKGSINKISTLNAEFRRGRENNDEVANAIYQTLKVENTTPSVSGKDIPSESELRYLIKYNKGAQNRCVTVKDYIDRILRLPPKYGTPFRVGVMEENNKIMVYLLGIDGDGKLNDTIPVTLINNIVNYLSGYRMINDFVEVKSGKIINLSFDIDVIIDKNYEKTVVISDIISVIKNYMDVNTKFMGDEIYVGDMEKEISKTDGVINLIDFRVYNEHGEGYSSNLIGQETVPPNAYDDEIYYLGDGESDLIDIEATDGILYSDGDSMFEVKYPEKDIRVRIKEK